MTLSYEDCKELKGAGFPNINWSCKRDDEEHGYCRADKPDCKIQLLSVPTLSELVEACGEQFQSLYSPFGNGLPNDIQWRATGFHEGTLRTSVYGSTPEEAVKNLYLALHPKI